MHDISDPFQPKEVAYFVPEAPKGNQTGAIQINDVYVDENEIVYAVDRFTGGLISSKSISRSRSLDLALT